MCCSAVRSSWLLTGGGMGSLTGSKIQFWEVGCWSWLLRGVGQSSVRGDTNGLTSAQMKSRDNIQQKTSTLYHVSQNWFRDIVNSTLLTVTVPVKCEASVGLPGGAGDNSSRSSPLSRIITDKIPVTRTTTPTGPRGPILLLWRGGVSGDKNHDCTSVVDSSRYIYVSKGKAIL